MKIKTIEELRKLYEWPTGRAARKVLPQLEYHSENIINNSPFCILATFDKKGNTDASPKGGEPGFVKILNKNTLLIPDSKGNNRVDSLVNIIETERAGLIFFIPGINETLRINGAASISTDQKHLNEFINLKNTPISCLVIKIEEVYLHCAKALMRSKLWEKHFKIDPKEFPTMGRMLKDQLKEGQLESREDMEKRYFPDL